ncbi:MAG: hypothetical protein R3324_05440 [Halobacteriales archaeon]|nr:hypothetical protein [Halobacteriales archaeon]
MPTISFGTTADGSFERVEMTRDGIEFDESLEAWRVRTDTRELIIPDEDVEEIVSDTGEPLFGY